MGAWIGPGFTAFSSMGTTPDGLYGAHPSSKVANERAPGSMNHASEKSTLVLEMSTSTSRPRPFVDSASILFGMTRRRVLGWLLTHPDEDFYLREIVRRTGSGHGAVQRELESLVAAGLLRRTLHGRQVYFQAERASPIFPELNGLFIKTAGIADVLREALKPLSRRITVSFVFGSAARGELRHSSDIDVFVVGAVSFLEIVDALGPVQSRLGREVNPVLCPPAEFREKLRAGHHFLTSVLAGPRVFVIGGPDEIAKLGTQKAAGAPVHERERRPGSGGGRHVKPRRRRD